MNSHLRQLVRLQDLMQTIEKLEEKIAAIPSDVARLEKDLLGAQAELEKQRAQLDELQKARRKLEMDLMGVETRIQKYQAQLYEVKTNKEYQAVLKEVETARGERSSLDEKILLEMEEAENRSAVFKDLEKGLEEKRRATEEGKRRLAGHDAELEREKARVEAERQSLAGSIPKDYLDPFLKVAIQRKGLALVPVRDELCGGCHVRVMPKLIQQVRRAFGLIACDSCKRFMYVLEEGPPAPAAAGSINEPPTP